MQICYTDGYKYRLEESVSVPTGILGHECTVEGSSGAVWVSLAADGLLYVREGYCWDGASGPTWDTKSTQPASLMHDALYQLLREGGLPQSARPAVDELFRRHLRQDGVGAVRAWYFWRAVSWFGGPYAARKPRLLQYAPA